VARRPDRSRLLVGKCVTVAALFVATGGCYFGLQDIDPWDVHRDARTYDGPHPVVAHPPCARWCRLAGLVESRGGPKRGHDGGCFAAALAAVRRWGGVLEHPAWSGAWPAFGLPPPNIEGGWQADIWGGWCCHVEQRWYGHRASKATWLYAVGCDLPQLRWGAGPEPEARYSEAAIGARPRSQVCERMSKRERNATPLEFRDVLIAIARTAHA